MARKATARPAYATPVVKQDTEEQVVEAAPAVAYEPAPAPSEPTVLQPATKSARVKGTWTMYYAMVKYDFVDGQRYDLPVDLFNYLKNAGNIYDTL